MAPINLGINQEQLVNESIDEVVLRLLGLDNINDLDYDTYKTLLKERLVKARNRPIPTEEDQKLRDEYSRVRGSTGRFRVNKKPRTSFNALPGRPRQQQNVATPNQKLLPGSAGGQVAVQQQQKQAAQTQQDIMGTMEFLTNIVSPSLTRIEQSLTNILGNLQSQQTAEAKASEQARRTGQKQQKRSREESREGGFGLLQGFKNTARKVLTPVNDVLGAVFKFISNIFLGILALGLVEFLKDPAGFLRGVANAIIGFANFVISGIFNFVLAPVNLFISGLNTSLQGLAAAINNTIGQIPGVPPITIPTIPNVQSPQIPYIPAPSEPNEPQKTNNKQVPTMESGGQVHGGSGQRVRGAGPDTQLVALQPGEIVFSKKAVDHYGADTLLGMNAIGGGTNRPGMARVSSVSGGGILPTMSGGGIVLNPPTMDAYLKAAAAASNEGIDLGSQITSTYRSAAKQQELIDRFNAGDPNVFTPAAVGKSPHQQGWSIDMNAGSSANQWMRKNGGKFGFRWQGDRDPVHFDFMNDQPNDYWLQEGRTGWQNSGGQTAVSPQQTAMGNSSNNNPDFWTLAAIASLESGNPQGRADVAQSIYNRAASGGVYTGSGSVKDIINASGQYQPVSQSNASLWAAIKDKQSAIAAVESHSRGKGRGQSLIEAAVRAITDPALKKDALAFIGSRTDFSTPSAMSVHADYRGTHRADEVSRHGHVFGWFVGPGAVTYGTKVKGQAGAAAISGSPGSSTPPSSNSKFGDPELDRMYQESYDEVMANMFGIGPEGGGGLGGNYKNPNPYNEGYSTTINSQGAGMPFVSPGRMTTPPGPPRGRRGDAKVAIPVSTGGGETGSSAIAGNNSPVMMFDPQNRSNPDIMVVQAIYNMVTV